MSAAQRTGNLSSAFLGLRRRELDPGRWVIRGLEGLGLVWNVKHPSARGQELKLLRPGEPALAAAADRATPEFLSRG